MDAVRVACPACRAPLHVAGEHLGRAVRCPGCGGVFRTPAPPVRLSVASATTRGRLRAGNEDALLTQQLVWSSGGGRHELALLVVADGMGGHAAGEQASRLAVAAVARALMPRLAALPGGEEACPPAGVLVEWLDWALWEANRAVLRAAEEPSRAGMGATAAAALVLDTTAAICHVGDCRVYHQRGGQLRRLTRDQTLAQRLVDLGTLDAAEADRHPAASGVTRALGRPEVEPSRQTLVLLAGDWLLLACDGLHSHLDDPTVGGAIDRAADPAALAADLIDRVNRAGGRDNCTVVVVRAEALR